MGEKLREVNSRHQHKESTYAAGLIDNDHALTDAERENQFAAASTDLAKEKTKRRSKPLLVLLAALVVAGLGGLATLAVYKAYFEKPLSTSQSTTTAQVTTPAAKKLDAATVLRSVTPSYAPDSDGHMQSVKVAGYNFFTTSSPAAMVKKDVAYSQSSVETAAIAKSLKDKGFVETIALTGIEQDSMYIAHYTEKDVICRVSVTKTYNNPTGDHLVQAGCQNMSTIVSETKKLKPFFDLLPAEIRTGSPSMMGDATRIVASKTTGYATLSLGFGAIDDNGELGLGSAHQLFYQTPDKSWHYFIGAQNTVLNCEQYDTTDLKKAYLGERCYDTATNNDQAIVSM